MSTPERLAWHDEQFAHPKRSTVALREFVARVLDGGPAPAQVLDAACGGGANMHHLSSLWPDARWTGVDRDEEAIRAARPRLDDGRFTLVAGDLARLEEQLGPKSFDISFSIMVLSWLEDYERAVQQMMAVTRHWLFVLNLFSETHVDAFTRVVGRMPGPELGYSEHYNVYSLPRFEQFCRSLGARRVVAQPFEIDLDLPRSPRTGMGTFTERTADGRRLQFSGPLLMPWWFVAVAV